MEKGHRSSWPRASASALMVNGMKILFMNLGYARGISGSLAHHIRYAHRHFYCSPSVQKQSLNLFNSLMREEKPDIACLVEIDRGSFGTSQFNQVEHLLDETYSFSNIENKYAHNSFLRSFGPTSGKSNAFIARKKYDFEKLSFACGVKRLVYKIKLSDEVTLFFAHFSLNRTTRARQILEAREQMRKVLGEVIFLGDFNVLSGLHEIEPMLDHGRHMLLNRDSEPTFLFHKRKLVLDLCITTPLLAGRAHLRVLPQTYSDHAALILDIRPAP